MSKLSSEMKALAKKAGGSFKTVNDRIHITKRFSEHLRALNIQIQRVEQIRVRHIECYIEERLTNAAKRYGGTAGRAETGWTQAGGGASAPDQ